MKRVFAGLILLITALVLVACTSVDTVSAQEDDVLIRGNPVPLTARLLQNGTYGDPVSYQRLDFYDQSQDTLIDSKMTDGDGYATVVWNIAIDHPLGPSVLNVTFEGNNSLSLAPSYQWLTVFIVSETTMEVQTDSSNIHPEDAVSLTVKLIDDHAMPIAGASIDIYADAIHVSTATTNGTGHATFSINCNSSWCSIGTNNLRAVYNGDTTRFYNSSASSFQIEIQQITTTLEIQSSIEAEVQLNKSYSLQTFIQADGLPHSDVPIIVLLDGNLIDTVASDEYGAIDLVLDIDHRYTLGLHTLRIEYQGTFRYASSHLDIDITVLSPALIHLEFPNQVIAGANTEIEASLQDTFQRPIPNAFLEIYDSSVNVTHEVSFLSGQSSTTALIVCDGPLGPRHLLVTVSGSSYLTNATKLIIVTVWTQPSLSLVQSSTYGYASPSQDLFFEVQLNVSTDSVSDRYIEWRISESIADFSITNHSGIAEMSLTAPAAEGHYILTMQYNGSQKLYELPVFLEYEIIVRWIMPVRVDLISYSISSALQEIAVRLSVIALNGTALEGITLHYEWLNHQDSALSRESGIIELALRVPANSGVYYLSYETEEAPLIQPSTGHHILIISQSESMASQGVGIPVLALSLAISISMAIIPILWRRRIID